MKKGLGDSGLNSKMPCIGAPDLGKSVNVI
jgi:hypothetical protein